MGASHTTLASTSAGGEEGILPELDGGSSGNNASNSSQTNAARHDLSVYALDEPLFPGSGRMMRTFRLRHKQNGSKVILKTMYVAKEHESLVNEQELELKRILEALEGQPHVAPFLYWSIGPYRQKTMSNNVPTMARQVSLLRPHMYTTLSDRIASRPFLTHVEKLWISYQLLQALEGMHSKGIVHGFLTSENVGLTSWNWVVLLDVASYKARTALPDDDPTEYLYYFQENYSHPYAQGTDTTRREKRCYLAPERFFTPNLEQPHFPGEQQQLTAAMDIFSAACVLMETFLNGERAMDLGDLMEYRKKQVSGTLQQKLNKIEFSAVRAACRHMLHLEPSERLSAKAYVERLEASDLIPQAFKGLSEMMEKVTFAPPDARLAIAVSYYARILWEAVGVKEIQGVTYMQNVLGSAMAMQKHAGDVICEDGANDRNASSSDLCISESNTEEKKDDSFHVSNAVLFSETDELLRKLKNLNFDEGDGLSVASKDPLSKYGAGSVDTATVLEQRSEMSRSSLLIYLQLVVSTVRHVQRPSSKLVALQLMERIGKHSSDEARLQHIVPVAVSLLQDQDSLVRALAIQVLSNTVSTIESFPPSDSKVFPEYIFKRASHLITDPAMVVRLAFANSVAVLAETSLRFLDISQAVRLYEAVGGGGGGRPAKGEETSETDIKLNHAVFNEDVANLLDGSTDVKSIGTKTLVAKSSKGVDSVGSDTAGAGKSLINSTYATELAVLHDTVSRWVVHITTDRSEQSSPVKRALLSDMTRLCAFFGLDGVMAFILPQLLSFLNDRKDWLLREALFECLPSVCNIIGRSATEHFVLPCLEAALVDGVESVISRALQCLAHLVTMGLTTRSALLGTYSGNSCDIKPGLLNKYAPLLVHPSADIRFFAVATINACCQSLGHPDADVFVAPVLRSFLRFQPTFGHLTSKEGLRKCLKPPWTRQRFNDELESIQSVSLLSPTAGHWTSVGLHVRDGSADSPVEDRIDPEESTDQQTQRVRLYLSLLARSRAQQMQIEKDNLSLRTNLNHCIEGSLKLSQQIQFPKQTVPGLPGTSIPPWFEALRIAVRENNGLAESASIRSVSAIGQIYGLSIMDQDAAKVIPATESMVEQTTKLLMDDSLQIEAASGGQWGSETCLDPTLSDTSLLVTKLNALRVPPLPPRLVEEKQADMKPNLAPKCATREQPTGNAEWKLKIDTMVASSKCTPEHGHTAPIIRLVVSHDQRFFVTGSHDSTCRIWELEKTERSNGILESSAVYTGHHNPKSDNSRINDLAMVEGGHSAISGASDGSVHVWRVDLVSGSMLSGGDGREVSRVVGSSEIRRTRPDEGEILAVNHFNTSSASIFTYATQRGFLHSWDLRSALEPFSLKLPQDTGYITSMAMGNDRNWVVLGTSKGFISLWDLRFQQILKLWHHSRASPVNRLATSFVPPPQSWIVRGGANSEARPFVFAACGPNECGMFDLSTGACRECFRTVDYGSRSSKSRLDDMPSLQEMSLSLPIRRSMLLAKGVGSGLPDSVSSAFRSVNAMVGSIGASDQSFLITGGSDCRIRYWDFAMPSKCYVSSGPETVHPRPTFERIDYSQSSRLMLCRQPPTPTLREVDGSKIPRKVLQGAKRLEKMHDDAITDLKMFKSGLLSCSRDCTVKLWR